MNETIPALSLVFPAFNEAENLPALLESAISIGEGLEQLEVVRVEAVGLQTIVQINIDVRHGLNLLHSIVGHAPPFSKTWQSAFLGDTPPELC